MEKFTQILKNNKYLFVIFSADWCGPCRRIKPVIEDKSLIYKTVTFHNIKVDNDEEDIATFYKVNGIPTIIVFKNQKEIGRIGGYCDVGNKIDKYVTRFKNINDSIELQTS